MSLADTPEYYAPDRASWRAWLETHHDTEQSIWLVYDKGKGTGLSYDELVEESLCFGWVDGLAGSVNDKRTKIYVSRRKPKSVWAKTNKARIAAMLQAGLMTPAGEAAVAVAMDNGAWDALNRSDNLEMPPELAAGLAANLAAKEFYDKLPPSSQKMILEWIYSAKTDATTEKRIAATIELSAQGIRAR